MSSVVYVDVLCPVFNAEVTIQETILSALRQSIPIHLIYNTNKIHQRVGDDVDLQSSNYKDGYRRYMFDNVHIDVAVCCYDDGSTDKSLSILQQLELEWNRTGNTVDRSKVTSVLSTQLLIGSSKSDTTSTGIAHSKGAGFARNRAASLRTNVDTNCNDFYFLCLLDSDDIMHPHRIAEQISVMMHLPVSERHLTLLGCTFDRIPNDSTWHYSQWANSLTDERLYLERYREVTVLQPTWMLTKKRFQELGGYIESPPISNDCFSLSKDFSSSSGATTSISDVSTHVYRLIHAIYDTPYTLRLAEDLRFFYAHLVTSASPSETPYYTGTKLLSVIADEDKNLTCNLTTGILKLIRTKTPLLTYRHRVGMSQSSSTSRKLLFQLRVKAFEDNVIRLQRHWSSHCLNYDKTKHICTNECGFVIWGCGRDGKDFFKLLSPDVRHLVRAFVDVDEKKISSGYYCYREDELSGSETPDTKQKPILRIPIVHFSYLIRDDDVQFQVANGWLHGTTTLNEMEEFHLPYSRSDEYLGKISKFRPTQSGSPTLVTTYDHKSELIPTKMKRQKLCTQRIRKLHNISSNDAENITLLVSLKCLPVVVCVAMYRTNGFLEKNVQTIGRTEGIDLWHFC